MVARYIMALDQGTSSSRAIIYSLDGQVCAMAQHDFEMSFPRDGWVEQDPEVLWDTTLRSGRDAMAAGGIKAEDIACIGITNQRETTLAWDRSSGKCFNNAIVWQDRRTADRCAEMAEDTIDGQSAETYIRETTGLVIDPYFSGTKYAWLLDHVDGLRDAAGRGEVCLGTVDSFLLWRLTGGAAHVTDASNASRTQLFDIHRQQYAEPLLDYFDIPADALPRVADNAANLGMANAEWFGAEIPVTGMAGDQQAALVGQCCFEPGMTKSTYGTGCFVMTNTGTEALTSQQALLTTIAYRLGGTTFYALEGSVFVAGVAVKWLRDNLAVIDSADETSAAFAACKGDTGGVYVVPAFTGLGAPHWDPHARALVTGLTLDTSREQFVTAFLQGVAFQTGELFEAMAKDGAPVEALRVDGGMSVNDELCQFIADVVDVTVERPRDIETTALGAAMLAGLGQGLFTSLEDVAGTWALQKRFSPEMAAQTRSQLKAGYAAAVERTILNSN